MEWLKLLNSFWVGGIFCLIAQILIDKTKFTPARIMVSYVLAGVILSALGIYKLLIDFAGCGASIPIIGFGHCLATGVKEAVREKGFMGIFSGGITSCASGISVAVFLGFLFSLIFKPKGKR